MAVQDPVGLEWATKLMASLRRDAELDAPRPAPDELDAPRPAPGDLDHGRAEVPAPEPGPAAATGTDPDPPSGLLASLSPPATAPARPAVLESPLLGLLGGAKLASVPAPPDGAGTSFADASPLLASMRARETAKPVPQAAETPAEPAPAEPATEAAASSQAEQDPAAEQAQPPSPEPDAEAPPAAESAEPLQDEAAPGPAAPAEAAPEAEQPVAAGDDAAQPVPVDPALAAGHPAPAAPPMPDPEAGPPAPAEPATPAPAPEPVAAKPAEVQPGDPLRVAPPDLFGQASLAAAHAALAGSSGAQPLRAAEGPSWVALLHSLDSARSAWSALFLGGAATTALPLRGALGARARGLAPVLHVTEARAERMAQLRGDLAANALDGDGTTLVTAAVEADLARLGSRAALAQDLLEASETWDLVRIGLPGIAGPLLNLDMPLLTRKVRWLMLVPNSRAEEAEALCHLLRARWRLVAERPAQLNPAAPAVASRPGGQLWRGPLD
jgi:hypothetical protein